MLFCIMSDHCEISRVIISGVAREGPRAAPFGGRHFADKNSFLKVL